MTFTDEQQSEYFKHQEEELEQRFLNVGLELPDIVTPEWVSILEELEQANAIQ